MPLEEGVRECRNTLWAPACLHSSHPGPRGRKQSTPARTQTMLPSWKSWFWAGRDGVGGGGFRGPRAAARELFPSAAGPWPPRAVAWKFLLWETASCQGHVSNDHRRVLSLLGAPGKEQFVLTGGERRGRGTQTPKDPWGASLTPRPGSTTWPGAWGGGREKAGGGEVAGRNQGRREPCRRRASGTPASLVTARGGPPSTRPAAGSAPPGRAQLAARAAVPGLSVHVCFFH